MPKPASGRQLSGNNWQQELGAAKPLLITIVRQAIALTQRQQIIQLLLC
jgi:hypothetical protein